MTQYIPWPRGFAIDPRKVTHFLLDLNGQKPDRAAFFLNLGFDPAQPAELMNALLLHTSLANYDGYIEVGNGLRLYFRGTLITPTGPYPKVRSIWQLLYNDPMAVAQFVTSI